MYDSSLNNDVLSHLSQVDGHRNRTGISPGPLVGLDVFSQLFVGGYNEFTPELLPLGSRFCRGFQGKIATALLQPRSAIGRKSTRAWIFSQDLSLFFLFSFYFLQEEGEVCNEKRGTGQNGASRLIISALCNCFTAHTVCRV